MQEDCMLLKEGLFSKFLRLLPENLFYTYLYLSKYKTKGVIFIKGSFIQGESKKCPLVRKAPLLLTDIFLTHPVEEHLNFVNSLFTCEMQTK